jgi:uncharacterized protein (TIGR00255 family)
MKSMTGFASLRKKQKKSSIEIVIRSVNGRFLEPRFHIPREVLHLEGDLRRLVQKYFQRGTLDVFIHRKILGSKSGVLNLDEGLLEDYLDIHKKLCAKMKVKTQATADFVIKLPEVVKFESTTALTSAEEKELLALFEACLKACGVERAREGLALQKHVLSLIKTLEDQLREMVLLRSQANEEIGKRFDQKLKLRLEGRDLDPQRLSQEIAILLEKSDINEEIQRLTEHLKHLKSWTLSSAVEGKKMDFYVQELLREVNTIGSKSQVAKLTTTVIEAKSIIEKLREQVQNIE